jgi:hypothetical protein
MQDSQDKEVRTKYRQREKKVVVLNKAKVRGRPLSGIAGLNPVGEMKVFCVLYGKDRRQNAR